jgi:hypothetical protein
MSSSRVRVRHGGEAGRHAGSILRHSRLRGVVSSPRDRLFRRERAHRHARAQQLGDYRATDSARGSRHEDGTHACACHDSLDRVRCRAVKLTGG